LRGRNGGHVTGKGSRDEFEIGVEMIRVEEPVLAMKVTGRKIFLKGRCANGDAIEFDCCPGRSAGDFESMG
jgi:hypothetical protein